MTLRVRVAAFVAVAVGLAVAVVAVAAYDSTRNEMLAEIDRFLRSRAPLAVEAEDPNEHIPGSGQGSGSGSGPVVRPRGISVVGDDVAAQMVSFDGRISVLGSEDLTLPVTPEDLAIATGDAPEVVRTITFDGADWRVFTGRFGLASALMIGRDLTETAAILEGLRNRLVLIGVAGALLAGIAGWLLAGRAVRPVRELTSAAEAVASTGALDAKIPVARSDEIGRLAGAFNEMLARLETSRVAQQRLVADASHELRTPLTSVRTNIELLARGTVPESERAAMLQDLTAEVVELGTLVGELVDLATVGRDEEERVEVDLALIVADVTARAARRASQVLEVVAAPVVKEMRPAAVARAISNLIDNAIKWSPPDGVITVDLNTQGISVRDRGPGIPPEDLPFVFQRFYRSTSARAMPGSGLGLAIVSAVAEDHGWSTVAQNREGGGAEVGWRFGES